MWRDVALLITAVANTGAVGTELIKLWSAAQKKGRISLRVGMVDGKSVGLFASNSAAA